MENDKQTKLKLIECAKKEFIEKGYMKASLRNICSEAGVTTGAMYFFFKDKEELFESVVGGPLINLMNAIGAHFDQETDFIGDVNSITSLDLKDDYIAASDILSVLFRYKEEYLLLMNRAQGSKYEKIVEHLDTIDDLIRQTATGWTMERMGKVDLTILRLAVYEMKMDDTIPVSVAINEAVELAKKFGQDESPSFVNGVLAKFTK